MIKEYNTSMFQMHCSYCGEKMKAEEFIGDFRDLYKRYYCECDKAQQEAKARKQKEEAENKLHELELIVKKGNKTVNKIKYEMELKGLKKKYNII